MVVVVLLWLGGSGWAVWRYYDTAPTKATPTERVTTPEDDGTAVTVLEDGVVVPDAVGRLAMAGALRLQRAGLAVTLNTSPSILVPEAVVIEQQPEAGVRVAPGTVVEITVSTGPP